LRIRPFQLERYFSRHEFTTPHLLCCSDCEPLRLQELLDLADDAGRRLWEELSLAYTRSRGHPDLREEIARLYGGHPPSNIVVVIPEEGIFLFMHTVLRAGDHIIVTYPGYQSLYEIARSLGCRISRWIPREEHCWQFQLEDLMPLIRENTRLLVLNFPHNPTGAILTPLEYQKIAGIADQHDLMIFSDEMYRFLEHSPGEGFTSLADLTPRAIVLGGLSKSFSLPGLRIGWMVSSNQKLLDELVSLKDYTSICNSAPSEILAIMALRARDRIHSRNRDIIQTNLRRAEDFFGEFPRHFHFARPRGGPIAFPRLQLDIPASRFCDGLRTEKGVLLLPSTVYDFGDRHFRIGLGRRDFPVGLRITGDFLREKFPG